MLPKHTQSADGDWTIGGLATNRLTIVGMARRFQFSLAHLLIELSLVALSIRLILHLYRTRNVMWPQTWWWAVPAATIVVAAAVGGVFGKIKAGVFAALAA